MKTNESQTWEHNQTKINESRGVNTNLGTRRNSAWIRRRELIAELPFFKGFNNQHLDLLTDDALEMQFPAGKTIFREGDLANRFYLILEGKIVLESELEDGSVVPIQTLGPGDDLGSSWMFSPYSFQFNARTIEPTKAIFFYGTCLREASEQDHDFGYALMKRTAHVMMDRLQATRSQLLTHLGKQNNPSIQ